MAEGKEEETARHEMPLHVAVKEDNYPTARLLLQNGAEINQASANNNLTPLHAAVRNQSVEMVSLLLMFGAEANPCQNNDGKTPLYLALESKNYVITEMLLKRKASIQRAARKDGSVFKMLQKMQINNRLSMLVFEHFLVQSIEFRDSLSAKRRSMLAERLKTESLLVTVLKKNCFSTLFGKNVH